MRTIVDVQSTDFPLTEVSISMMISDCQTKGDTYQSKLSKYSIFSDVSSGLHTRARVLPLYAHTNRHLSSLS